MSKKVLVALSGGVDSAVSVVLLKNAGYEVETATFELDNDEKSGVYCKAVSAARQSAVELGVKHHVFNFKSLFEEKVVKNFCSEYCLGHTPNPCVACNKYIKFGAFFQKAMELGFDYIATGHYANILCNENTYCIKTAKDEKKDQTYMLYNIEEEKLPYILFPCGNLTKDEIRKIAKENNLSNFSQKDSLEICFIPDNDYSSFLKSRGYSSEAGDFVDINGNYLAKHKGIINYTIGQRKGLGIALGKPAFVVNIDSDNNKVVLGENKDLFKNKMRVKDCRFISSKYRFEKNISVKIRYSASPQPAKITDITDSGTALVVFDSPQRAITPGQSAVFYNGDILLGGGIIIE